jgi:hypothetical protein
VSLQTTRAELRLDPMLLLASDEILSYGLASQQGEQTSINERGEFIVKGLIPGVKNYLTLDLSSNRAEYVPIDPLEPGQQGELANVKPIVLQEQN